MPACIRFPVGAIRVCRCSILSMRAGRATGQLLGINALAYLPLGFFLAAALSRLPGRLTGPLLAMLLAALISLAMECAQTVAQPGAVQSRSGVQRSGRGLSALLALWCGEPVFRVA